MPSSAHLGNSRPSLRERIANAMALVAFALCAISPFALFYLWLVQWLQPDYFRSLYSWTAMSGVREIDRYMYAALGYPAAAFALAFASLLFKSTPRAGWVMLLCLISFCAGMLRVLAG